jgi:hypothetical protein
MAEPYGCLEKDLTRYVCRTTTRPPLIDGALDDDCGPGGRSPRFVDLVTGVPGLSKPAWPRSGTTSAPYRLLIEERTFRPLTERDSFI